MGKNAQSQIYRGSDVSMRLYDETGRYLDIMEYDHVELHYIIKNIDASSLAVGYTVNDTHADGVDITCKGARRGSDWLEELDKQVRDNMDTGKRFRKYSASITYIDRQTLATTTKKFKNLTIMDADPINSGEVFSKQEEGFKMHGQPA